MGASASLGMALNVTRYGSLNSTVDLRPPGGETEHGAGGHADDEADDRRCRGVANIDKQAPLRRRDIGSIHNYRGAGEIVWIDDLQAREDLPADKKTNGKRPAPDG